MIYTKLFKIFFILLFFSSTSLLGASNLFCSKFRNDNTQTFDKQKHHKICHKKSDSANNSANKSKVCLECKCNVGNFFQNKPINISTYDFSIEYEIFVSSLNYQSNIKNKKPPPKLFS